MEFHGSSLRRKASKEQSSHFRIIQSATETLSRRRISCAFEHIPTGAQYSAEEKTSASVFDNTEGTWLTFHEIVCRKKMAMERNDPRRRMIVNAFDWIRTSHIGNIGRVPVSDRGVIDRKSVRFFGIIVYFQW
ncbi:unnamed protein product [Albugo candida]|uniref:Uncharacterized protein n=1 Tax=Albugo candida TaxID=65357 RepID=A0A024GPF1_9STRA|nr:unnamed protein product [Albugo candida]|eukprot:CCI48610.1 unnamed protein product [Albugo candida]